MLARLAGWAAQGLLGGGGAVLALVALFLLNLWRKQESLLYHPQVPGLPFSRIDDTPPPFNSPAAWGLRHEERYLDAADGTRIHMWHVRADCDAPALAPTVAFFHANAGNMGLRLPNVAMLASAIPANVAIIDYRGYGNSGGSPTEAGLRLDAAALLAHLAGRADVQPGRLFLFGRSLGGAVAVRAAGDLLRPADALGGLIVENTFTSISAMVDAVLPWLSPVKRLVLRMHWPSVDVLAALPAELPVLVVSGERDPLVPPAHAAALAAAARTRRPGGASVVGPGAGGGGGGSVGGGGGGGAGGAGGGAGADATASSTSGSGSGSGSGSASGGVVVTHVVPGAGHDDCAVKGGVAYVDALRSFMDAALAARGLPGTAAGGPPRRVRVPAGVPPAMVPAGALGTVALAEAGGGGGVAAAPVAAAAAAAVEAAPPAAAPAAVPVEVAAARAAGVPDEL